MRSKCPACGYENDTEDVLSEDVFREEKDALIFKCQSYRTESSGCSHIMRVSVRKYNREDD